MNNLTIVIPVYNEKENICTAIERIEHKVQMEHIIAIVYDTEKDTTLPVIQELKKTISSIKVIKNAYGCGVLNAIKTGLEAAETTYAVVTMADLSDPPEVINDMYRIAEAENADIVCASRYMKGGKQIGGPQIKSLMSRVAGLTLHFFAQMPTHDATNSFKLYRISFLRKQKIESTGGFELGLELVAKAHINGNKICETPTTWTERIAGKSNFKLLAWLRKYLHWYFYALNTSQNRLFCYIPNLIKYFISGTFCALLNLTAFYVFNYILRIQYIPAAVIAFIVAASVSFLFSTRIFKSRKNERVLEYFFVIASSIMALLLDLLLMYVLITNFSISPMLAKTIGIFVEFIFNFLVRQFFIFSPEKIN